MKKSSFKKGLLVTLLSTVCVSNSFAQRANSDRFSAAPAISVGGFVNFSAALRSEDSAYGGEKLPDADTENPLTTGTANRQNNNPDFTNEAEIHIKVAGINEFGMKYGAVVELQGNTGNAARNEGLNADKAYIFTESRLGKMEFGNNSAVNHKMKVGPETFARGAGGINGKYLEYVTFPLLAHSSQMTSGNAICNSSAECANVKLPSFILIPQSPVAHGGYARGFYNSEETRGQNDEITDSTYIDGIAFNSGDGTTDGQFGDMEDATKINYYTPRISGWQLGLTLTPDTGSDGTSASVSGANNGDIKQVISYGLNYSDNFGNLGFALSATGENGRFEQPSAAAIKRNNLKAYDVGFMATYFGFTLGASYGDWGNSLQPKTGSYSCNYDSSQNLADQDCANGSSGFSGSTYQTAGLAYQFGPFASSLTYMESSFQDNDYTALSFGIDYKMAKGLMPYLEVTQYELSPNQPKASDITAATQGENQLQDNKGYVALAGLLFSF
ncbi:MAG: hypothetical protein ACJA0S_000160 [Rickettsiales bacterium]|jgi:hypothetical protein